MNTKTRTIIGIVVLIIVIAGGWLILARPHADTAQADVRTTVTDFGSQLQKVSLLAPTAGSDIATTYAPYVDADLLAKWKADPSTAPGRQTSSPWPDHIEITNVQKSDEGAYIVSGTLVLMTSNEVEHGGNAGTAAVSLTLHNEKGQWKIVEYSQGAYMGPNGMTATSTASTTDTGNENGQEPASTSPAQPPEPAPSGALHVSSIAPSSGDAGTRIIMTGTGFTQTSQVILDDGRGAVSNVQVNGDGTVLTFIMPDSVGAYCAPKHACPLYALLLKPGTYDLAVRNTDGTTSNAVTFTLTGTTLSQ
jgi:hypothetical protein